MHNDNWVGSIFSSKSFQMAPATIKSPTKWRFPYNRKIEWSKYGFARHLNILLVSANVNWCLNPPIWPHRRHHHRPICDWRWRLEPNDIHIHIACYDTNWIINVWSMPLALTHRNPSAPSQTRPIHDWMWWTNITVFLITKRSLNSIHFQSFQRISTNDQK